MLGSTSPTLDGYVVDTNVLSIFAKVGRLNLLLQIAIVPLHVTPAIQNELEIGLKNGVSYLADPLSLIDAGALKYAALTDLDHRFISTLPAKLASGEAEAIAVCARSNLTLISHDRKAIDYCEREKINCIRLSTLIALLRNANVSVQRVTNIAS